MSEARHPITNIGLLNLAARLIRHRKNELTGSLDGVRCRMRDDQRLGDRPCYCFIMEFDDSRVSGTYRKSIQYIDKEYSLPVCIKTYGWPPDDEPLSPRELDERTLIEFYCYSDIQVNEQLADADFDRANRSYRFRR